MEIQALPQPGQRIECVQMGEDPCPIRSGSQGTVTLVQEVASEIHIHVAWDDGRSLNLVPSVDRYLVLK